jgi:acyl-CoA thioesterase YciA
MSQHVGRSGREPMVRTVAMPADTNGNGDIFGGWVLSQMDIAGGIKASEVARGRTATVAIEAMKFHRPVAVGDIVSLYADIERIGRTSISVHIETIVNRRDSLEEIMVTEGKFIYVAIDDEGRPRPVTGEG